MKNASGKSKREVVSAERFKAAVVQAAPVIFDRERTLKKVDGLAGEAASQGARLVVFPEAHHGYGPAAGAYMMRRRWDYFITELMKATPPHEFPMPALLPPK